MDKKKLGEKLKALRESKYPDRTAFIKASGLEQQGVVQAEEGKRVLRIDRLQRWLETCGTTLPRFFADFAKDSKEDIRIVPGFEEYYRLLTSIIETKESFFIDGIHANLVAMARAAGQADHDEDSNARASPPSKPRRASSH